MNTSSIRIPTPAPIFSSSVEESVADCIQYLLQELVGLFPVQLAETARVLDVGCGFGQWAIEMAYAYPDGRVEGIDLDAEKIRIANMGARCCRRGNLRFSVADMMHLDNMPDACFDAVHARFLSGWVEAEHAGTMLRELLRVCRPGGILCWIEAGNLLTNSSACNRWYRLFRQACTLAGYARALTPLMEPLLEEADGPPWQRKDLLIDLSHKSTAHERLWRRGHFLSSCLIPFLVSRERGTIEELKWLQQEIWCEVLSDHFSAVWPLVVIWCEKHGV